MSQITQTYTLKAPISKVWWLLTTVEGAAAWGADPAKFEANEGGEFSYWDGDIHGNNTKIVPETLLEQDWYEHDHPERLHKVTFTFASVDHTTTIVHLFQTDVGDDELNSMADGWVEYYFDPIKKLLEQPT